MAVCPDVGDAPAMTADADEIAHAQCARTISVHRPYVVSGFRLRLKLRRTAVALAEAVSWTFGSSRRTRRWTIRLRNLHHASAIRAQIVPRACAHDPKTWGLPRYRG